MVENTKERVVGFADRTDIVTQKRGVHELFVFGERSRPFGGKYGAVE